MAADPSLAGALRWVVFAFTAWRFSTLLKVSRIFKMLVRESLQRETGKGEEFNKRNYVSLFTKKFT